MYLQYGDLHAVEQEAPVLRHPEVVLVHCQIKNHEVKDEEPLVTNVEGDGDAK